VYAGPLLLLCHSCSLGLATTICSRTARTGATAALAAWLLVCEPRRKAVGSARTLPSVFKAFICKETQTGE
jgi:hypothetical protein